MGMLLTVMREVNNFFDHLPFVGSFEIINSTITLKWIDLLVGGYVAITETILNNGVYLITDKIDNGNDTYTYVFDVEDNLRDEKVKYGNIYLLAIPRDFLDLVALIEQSVENTPQSNLTSERFFNDYTYSVAIDPCTGAPASWKTVFANNLNRFRKMFSEVRV